MRRISKGKRRKSESPSDAESEENGDNAHKTEATGDETKVDDNGDSAVKSKRKTSRGRDNKNDNTDAESTKQDDDADVNSSDTSSRHENGNVTKSGGEKRRRKEERKATTSQEKEKEESGEEYEVEKIVSRRTIKGRRQFLVRWKGYDETSDTWENEKDLNCPQLIEDFLADEELQQDQDAQETDDKPGKSAKSKPQKGGKRKKKSKGGRKANDEDKAEGNDDDAADDDKNDVGEKKGKKARMSKNEDKNDGETDEEKEFEVEKIIEVHFKKNKSREFLIRWKGFRPEDDTWEPEANLNCPELIAKFMEKLDKAKSAEVRELRTNPSHTKRYTLSMHDRQRRLSRRNVGKERATYHECDD